MCAAEVLIQSMRMHSLSFEFILLDLILIHCLLAIDRLAMGKL